MIRKHLLLLCTSALLLGACGENKNSSANSSTPDSSTNATSTASTSSNSSASPTIKVTVKNGPHAGTYEARCKQTCTSYGIAGAKVFGNQYSETGKSEKELSSVQLLVNDVTGDKQTKDFTLTVAFGDLLSSKNSYTINNLNGFHEGSGTLDLKYGADKANVKIDGTTSDGTQLEVSIDADKVMTASNVGQ